EKPPSGDHSGGIARKLSVFLQRVTHNYWPGGILRRGRFEVISVRSGVRSLQGEHTLARGKSRSRRRRVVGRKAARRRRTVLPLSRLIGRSCSPPHLIRVDGHSSRSGAPTSRPQHSNFRLRAPKICVGVKISGPTTPPRTIFAPKSANRLSERGIWKPPPGF